MFSVYTCVQCVQCTCVQNVPVFVSSVFMYLCPVCLCTCVQCVCVLVSSVFVYLYPVCSVYVGVHYSCVCYTLSYS